MNTQTIAVFVNPLPVIAISPASATLCAGSATVLVASGATSYVWTPFVGISCNTCSSPTANPTITTTYSITGTDSNGCINSTSVTVTINPLPTLTITPASATICVGASTSLLASGANAYTWLPATALSCTACTNPTASPTITTTYTVTGVNINGCVNTKTVTVFVNPLPVIAISPASATLCVGSSTLITASGASSYSWALTSGLSCTACPNPTASPTVTTTYTVTGVNINGCVNTQTIAVLVSQKINGSIIGDTAICFGELITLNALGGGNYVWSTGDITATVVISATTTTTYSVIIYNLGCIDTVYKTVTVNNLPTANAGNDTLINYNTSVLLDGSGGGTYNWSPPNNLNCYNCENPIANPTVSTQYTLTVTNNFGCEATSYVDVIIDYQCGEIFVPNVFSPNGDGQNDILYVENRCLEYLDFVIYDRWGEKVFWTDNPKEGWDGNYKGAEMNGSGIVYYLKARMIKQSDIILKKGNILILR